MINHHGCFRPKQRMHYILSYKLYSYRLVNIHYQIEMKAVIKRKEKYKDSITFIYL
jgi:hypothetical protein